MTVQRLRDGLSSGRAALLGTATCTSHGRIGVAAPAQILLTRLWPGVTSQLA